LKNFSDLGVETSILNAIQEMGFETPTPIQEQSIPVFLETGQDILGLAQTGTGKTAAFGLPIIQLVEPSNRTVQALVICPTRELCMQISKDLGNYSKNKSGINIVAVYGGSSIERQISDIKRGAHIIVATPGRLMDLMNRRALNISTVKYVVLDEADEMLNMGFEEDVEYILAETPKEKRVCLFSATMPKSIKNIANRYMNDPFEITVGKSNSGNVNITHQYAVVHARDKYAALKRFVDFNSDDIYAIIFCTTKHETQDISDKLIKDGYNADCLHGDLSQGQREKVMNRFRHHAIKILLATDVAARGIDVSGISHVIHFSLPDDIENYTHRSGRTGRAGKLGVSFTLLNMRENGRLRDIERLSNVKFDKILIPSAEEVRDKKLVAFIDTIVNTEIEESIFDDKVMTSLKPLLDLPNEELVQKFLSLELRRFSAEYLNAPDLNTTSGDRTRDGERSERGGNVRGQRIFVSVGKKDGFDIRSFKDWVAQESKLDWKELHVDVSGVFSFVDVKEEFAEKVITALNGNTYEGRPVRAELSGEKPGGSREGRGGRGGDRGGRSGGGGYSSRRSEGGSSSYGGGDRRRSSGGDRERGGERGGDRGGDRERAPRTERTDRSSYGRSEGNSDRSSSSSTERSGYGTRDGGRNRNYGDRPKTDRPASDRPTGDRRRRRD
jgi:ATP-dependent RNA helicase DeaD